MVLIGSPVTIEKQVNECLKAVADLTFMSGFSNDVFWPFSPFTASPGNMGSSDRERQVSVPNRAFIMQLLQDFHTA